MTPTLAILTALAFGAAPDRDQGVTSHEENVAGGEHWRIVTTNGPVHVWHPRTYEYETAGILIYVHGYYSNVDQAWSDHNLARQFHDSKKNALFLVPEAPISDEAGVAWKDLDNLFYEVKKMTGQRPPPGPVSVLAHSGGFRTVVEWLKNRDLDQIMLLDALYQDENQFGAWIKLQRKRGRHGNKLIVVSSETVAKSDAFVKRFPKAVTHQKIPDNAFELSKQERNADVLYMRTTAEHMQLVTEGKVIPFLIKLTPFPKL